MGPLRPAGPDDVPALVDLINRAYAVEADFVDGPRTTAAEVAGFVSRGAMLVLDEPPELSACVYLSIAGDRGYFGYLAVDPHRQGGGRGRRVIEEVEARCREAGCAHLDIQVVNLREELLPYYRKLGYVETGSRPFADTVRLKRPAHFVLFTKALR